MATNVPTATLGPQGFIAPQEVDVLAGVFADMQAAFGGNLNPSLATPQGQLATSLAAMIAAANDLFLLITNQVDPNFASGRMQDAIARIYFLERLPPLSTVVNAILTGAPGTLVPAGSLAQTVDGYIYQSLLDVTIASDGTARVDFQCLQTGPLAVSAGSLSRIYRAVSGWDSVYNLVEGTLGRDVETRAEFELRRQASVALNAVGILPAIRAAVLNVPDVIDAYVTENSTNANVTTGGVTLTPHSLYVCVYGGTDADVARAIWSKKNPGCDYVGGTTVTVQDTNSGYSAPYPSYPVTFARAVPLPVYVSVTLATNAGIPADGELQAQQAVLAAFNGRDGGAPARIGATLYASRFYAAVASLGSWAQVVAINIGTNSNPTGDSLTTQINQVPTLTAAHVTVTLA